MFVCIVLISDTNHYYVLLNCSFSCSYVEGLMYLIYAHQYNKELLVKGPYRGHDEELIAHYRRQCLLVSQ